ncbi:MAG: hypothetical protein JWO36_6195 [Myxococcales bacterium]|nr:hypothetical protein [Myxococcales bacterium]
MECPLQPWREMRFGKLLQHLAIAGLVGTGCSGNVFDNCVQDVQKSFVVLTPTDPSLELSIHNCRVDVDACPDLCLLVLQRAGIMQPNQTNQFPTDFGAPATPNNPIDSAHCSAQFEGQKVSVTVAYSIQSGGLSCPQTGVGGSGSGR